jgi:lysophospholipase L1-like esterase
VRQPTGPQGGVLLVGDSIAYRGTNELAPIEPAFDIDGFPGRRFTELDDRLNWFRTGRGQPDGVILELGTNEASTFTRSELGDVLGSLPPPTPLMLVLPFRSDQVTGAVTNFTKRYARWLRGFAQARERTCIADWPALVRLHPRLLVDGAHLTPTGESYWAKWIAREWRRCEAGS